MIVNLLLLQWDSTQWDLNEQVKLAKGQEELGRWLGDSEDPQQAQVQERQGWWQAAAVALSGVLSLVLILLI